MECHFSKMLIFVFLFFLFRISEGYLLPASPSEREIAIPEVNCTLFLLAGYAKYGQPYAWIRSNHERLVNIGCTDSTVKDTPVKLKSISEWKTQGVRIWDMVWELVTLCTTPPPINPFALDMRYIESLPLSERFLVSGALICFLERIVIHGAPEAAYYSRSEASFALSSLENGFHKILETFL
uniref:Si:dkey-19b23.7 n=1 Tax=Erpetoichthys calabaricus TaxID=27687 RepID=A0A8C4SI77_ERPCA